MFYLLIYEMLAYFYSVLLMYNIFCPIVIIIIITVFIIIYYNIILDV